MRVMIALFFLLALGGCAGASVANRSLPSEFTYNFTVPNKTKLELWKNAQDSFAVAYPDSRLVFRVMDEQGGMLIGKASARWSNSEHVCYTEYHILFSAMDNQARLQFKILEGVPPESNCYEWPWPSKNGYDEIVRSFDSLSKNLGVALSRNSMPGK